MLTSAPILIVPERGQRYIVYCDALKDGLGCVERRAGMCFNVVREDSSLWFSETKES